MQLALINEERGNNERSTVIGDKRMTKRKPTPVDVKALVLHEAGYRCANPTCRTILTIEIHHLDQVSVGGSNEPENLIALCPNCHTLHHAGAIPLASLRAWKHLLLALNEAFDRRLADLVLTLQKVKELHVSGDGVIHCSPGIAAGLIRLESRAHSDDYWVSLTKKGHRFVEAWERGDQDAAVGALAS
jgi:hypothetical protein